MITQYYTKAISEEVTKALHEVNFPFPIADMGFAVPQIVEMPVDYASVLDWLIEQDIQVSIGFSGSKDATFCIVRKENEVKHAGNHIPLLKTLDNVILLAIELLKSEKDDA